MITLDTFVCGQPILAPPPHRSAPWAQSPLDAQTVSRLFMDQSSRPAGRWL